MLRSKGIDAALVSAPANIRHLTGFSGSNGLLLVRPRSAWLYTDVRYEEQAAVEARGCSIRIARTTSLLRCASDAGHLDGCAIIGFEDRVIPFSVHANLRAVTRGSRLRPLGGLLEELRAVKDSREIAGIERAVAITDAAFAAILPFIRPGIRERELAAEVSHQQRLIGADGDAFDIIVLFGPDTSLIHGAPGDRRLRVRDLVLIDMGCRVGGLHSDMTRMISIGTPSREILTLHRALREAQDTARDMVAPGVSATAVDAAARAVLHRQGFGEHFPHSLGHGVGFEIHELPRLSPAAGASVLEPGHVVTIEPGIYLPGRIGARVEDMIAVETRGARTLTRTSPDLVVL